MIVHILQDGLSTAAVSSVVGTNIENLAGTDNVWTPIATGSVNNTFIAVGNPDAALHFLHIGRCLSTSAPTISGANSTSEDLYILSHEFSGVNTGTSLSDVIENGSAGTMASGDGTSTTVSDTDVTTLGAERLALNFVGIADDASGLASFTGETGGDWTLPANALFESASGTDGTVAMMIAEIASAGTIGGGSDTIVNLPWGVIGFALIPQAVVYQPRHGFVNHSNPGIF